MTDFSLSEFAKRKEYVYFQPDVPLQAPTATGIMQSKDNISFTINDRSGIYDYANGYFDVTLKIEPLDTANGASFINTANISMICGIHSLIRRLALYSPTGASIYNVHEINKAVFLRKLLEQSPDYAQSVAENEYWYLDKIPVIEDKAVDPVTGEDNRGNLLRSNLWTTANPVTTPPTQNYRIPLKWYSFFQSLNWENIMLTGMSLNLVVDLETDANLVWRTPATGAFEARVIVTQLRLALPQVELRASYYNKFLQNIATPRKWTYLKERIASSEPRKTGTGSFKVTSVYNPKKVFVYFLSTSKQNTQNTNMYIYDDFINGTIGYAGTTQKCTQARLEFSDGTFYPRTDYLPATQLARIYGDVMEYTHSNDDMSGGTQLSRNQFKVNPLFYFDLEYSAEPLVTDTRDMTFSYTLSGDTTSDYQVYAIILQEHQASYGMMDGAYNLTDEVSRG